MPRFPIERNFAEAIEVTKEGADQVRQINDEEGVRWLFSFLSPDKRKPIASTKRRTPMRSASPPAEQTSRRT